MVAIIRMNRYFVILMFHLGEHIYVYTLMCVVCLKALNSCEAFNTVYLNYISSFVSFFCILNLHKVDKLIK